MRLRNVLSVATIASLVAAGCTSTTVPAVEWPSNAADKRPARLALPMAQPRPATEVTEISPIKAAVRDIRDAVDMHAATEAYSRGVAVGPNHLALHKAYVQRMTDLDVPMLALDAAKKVVTAEPNSALARTILAISAGREGNMVDALTHISLAVRRAPENRLVQRTAGHLLAWYDNNPRPPSLPGTVRIALQDVHANLDDQATFVNAYADATDFYRANDAQVGPVAKIRPTTGPSTEQAVAGDDFDNGIAPDRLPGAINYYGAYSSPPPVIGYAAPVYYSGEPYAYDPYYFPGYWGWGSGFFLGAGFILLDRHHHHHKRDEHHGRDGQRGAIVGTGQGNVFLPTGNGFSRSITTPLRGLTGSRIAGGQSGQRGASFGGSNFRATSDRAGVSRDSGSNGIQAVTGYVGTPPTGYVGPPPTGYVGPPPTGIGGTPTSVGPPVTGNSVPSAPTRGGSSSSSGRSSGGARTGGSGRR